MTQNPASLLYWEASFHISYWFQSCNDKENQIYSILSYPSTEWEHVTNTSHI